MITTTKTNKLKIKTSFINKQLLIQMAKQGKPKPTQTKLGMSLYTYTNKSQKCYDESFDKSIRNLRPDWFVKSSDIMKQKLIQMAKKSKKTDPKPSQRTIEGKALFRYTSKTNKNYDHVFTNKIKIIRPEWLLNSNIIKTENRIRSIIQMAKNKENKRPAQHTDLGNFLSRRTTGVFIRSAFSKKIRKFRPDWFVTQEDKANNNKKELLKIASSGSDKPKMQLLLGRALFNYTNEKTTTYDKNFSKKIKKIRPDWFVTKRHKADQKRKDIIQAAKTGQPKPKFGTLLGNALVLYTGKSNLAYVPKFDRLIRKLRPDWFPEKGYNKSFLLKMALNGDEKPKQTGTQYKLGLLLAYYTGKNTHDPAFNKLLRKTRPDWFVRKKVLNKTEIINMAKNNQKKPSARRNPVLARLFYNLTNKNSVSYDKNFRNTLLKLRPDWFETSDQKKKNKQKQIIEMAKKGIKPDTQHPLFFSFHHYKSDSEFRKTLKSIRPDWFRK